MKSRMLGQSLEVSAIGFGAMALAGYYGDIEQENAIRIIHHALDIGMRFIDTADAYANGENERMIGQAIADRRSEAILATKFGIVYEAGQSGSEVPTNWGYSLTINGSLKYIQESLDKSLKRLDTDYVDLWYAHYPDPNIPIEETVGYMADAVKAGKVHHLGLSNVSGEQLRRAHAVHPIAAVQNEYSLFQRNAEKDILLVSKALDIGFVPWSPLGAGFLSEFAGNPQQNLTETDFRNYNPRFVGDNLKHNIDRFAPLREIAVKLSITPAQLALTWLLHQGERIVPIPGTRKPERMDENAAAADVQLNAEQLSQINERFPLGLAAGKTLLD